MGGMDDNGDYNLKELEEIALQIGSGQTLYTDDDGVDIDGEDEEEFIGGNVASNSSVCSETTNTSVFAERNFKPKKGRNKRNNTVNKRKQKLLNNHRKSMKLSLNPPRNDKMSKKSTLSPLSVDDGCSGYATTPISKLSSVDIDDIDDNDDDITLPLSPPRSTSSYHEYAD